MPNIVGVDRDIVEVPSVTGLGLEEAREKFFRSGSLPRSAAVSMTAISHWSL